MDTQPQLRARSISVDYNVEAYQGFLAVAEHHNFCGITNFISKCVISQNVWYHQSCSASQLVASAKLVAPLDLKAVSELARIVECCATKRCATKRCGPSFSTNCCSSNRRNVQQTGLPGTKLGRSISPLQEVANRAHGPGPRYIDTPKADLFSSVH
jgi:hypothetical protein